MPRTNSGWVVHSVSDYTPDHLRPYREFKVLNVSHAGTSSTDFAVISEYDYVRVVAVRIVDGVVHAVLKREDRVAEGYTIGCVAGAIFSNENPEAAAKRELEEETGWRCSQLVYLGMGIPQTAQIISRTAGNEGAKRVYGFLALELSPGVQQHDETEKLEIFETPWTSLLESIYNQSPVAPYQEQVLTCDNLWFIHLTDRYLREKRLL